MSRQQKQWNISDTKLMAKGSTVLMHDNNEVVNVGGYAHTKLLNPTIQKHRSVEQLDVFIGINSKTKELETIVVQVRSNSFKTIPYGHTPPALLNQLKLEMLEKPPVALSTYKQRTPIVKPVKVKATVKKTVPATTPKTTKKVKPVVKGKKAPVKKSKKPEVVVPKAEAPLVPNVPKEITKKAETKTPTK
jgi:DNA-directed RNA polymerase subunit L